MSKLIVNRRRLIGLGTVGGLSSLALGGCNLFDDLGDRGGNARDFLAKANGFTYRGAAPSDPGGMLWHRNIQKAKSGKASGPAARPTRNRRTTLALKASEFADYRLANCQRARRDAEELFAGGAAQYAVADADHAA